MLAIRRLGPPERRRVAWRAPIMDPALAGSRVAVL
jgi:hypothetical protein